MILQRTSEESPYGPSIVLDLRMEVRGARPAWPSLGYRHAPLPQGRNNAPPHWNVRESALGVNGSKVTLADYPRASK